MDVFITIIALILIGLTLTPFQHSKKWWIRNLDFPRIQLLCAIVMTLILETLFVDPGWWMAALTIGLCGAGLWHLRKIFPFTPLYPKQVPDGQPGANTLHVLTLNVKMENRQADACLKLIADTQPDVVLLVEVDSWWLQAVHALHDEYPHRIEHPLENTYGLFLYSKFPLVEAEIRFYTDPEIPSIYCQAEINAHQRVHLFCIHPSPPAPPMVDYTADSSHQRDTELQVVAKKTRSIDAPILVFGDLNDVAWSRTTRQFLATSQLLDPRRGRGLYNTFHAQCWLLRFPLDHFFHSEHFSLISIQRERAVGSDHFPISIRLRLNHDARQAAFEPH